MDNPLNEIDQSNYDRYVELHQELKTLLLIRENLEFDFFMEEMTRIRLEMDKIKWWLK